MRGLRRFILFSVLAGSLQLTCHAQLPGDLRIQEDSLSSLFYGLAQTRDGMEQQSISEDIAGLLNVLLKNRDTFDYGFDSIRNVGKIYSADRHIRIFTWNIIYADGSNGYYGFIQYLPDPDKDPLVFRLYDRSDRIVDPEQAIVGASEWYGSLVYDIIDQSIDNTMCYVLLCYDPNNLFISRRIIDILYFNDKPEPVFGKPVFLYKNNVLCRVLFQYSARAQMNLRWDPSLKMIVFDHLSPVSSSFQGNFQYYGPDFSYDGFRFEDGMWQLQQDIDVRNAPR